jgi:lipopolysaccharide/colanic/teichoic acid biosynthesis glycosyltransferase
MRIRIVSSKSSAAWRVERNLLRSAYCLWIKRWLDLLALAFLSPLILVIFAGVAVMVRSCLGRPLIFRQTRIGYREQPFVLTKFRTMLDARDANGNLLPDEQRLTAFGRFLRASSLDEIPTLWNVLRGEMSLVGPRPLLVEYLPLYDSIQRRRHEVKPGVTGLAQVSGRNAISWEKKFAYDVEYVHNVSLALDLKIGLLTIAQVFGRKGISHRGVATMPPFHGRSDDRR